MTRRKWSPTVRITIGLVSLMISVLLMAQLLGFIPETTALALDARKKVCEALASQLSWGASRNDIRLMEGTLNSLVERNDDILSAALRNAGGDIVAVAGSHEAHWKQPEDGRSTPTHVQVPLFAGPKRWGRVEISFTPLQPLIGLTSLKNSAFGLFLFVGLTGAIGFFVFLRRALRELDPSGVIPERVKGAFDALAEGVLIMDEDEHIVLANESFGAQIEQSAESLTGRKVSSLEWRTWKSGDGAENLPWRKAVREGKRQTGVPLLMQVPSGAVRTFMVNGTPILDGKGRSRGSLATFDDVTDVEKRNTELQRALKQLEQSKDEVNRQNKELFFLATRDSMTGCLNRRAFFERCEKLFQEARLSQQKLCCIMADIDHFKSINDEHGHAVGDTVIEFVAEVLRAEVRDQDLVCRYGGEEFCIILPGLGLEQAATVAERLRQIIRRDSATRLTLGKKVTASLGVAWLQSGIDNLAALVNEADVALYVAKESGRNRVACAGEAAADMEASGRMPPVSIATNGPPTLVLKPYEPDSGSELQKLRERIVELETLLDDDSVDLAEQAGFDDVTGLPNRLLFNDRVGQLIASAKRENCVAAILYVDIDLYRSINDTLGQETADGMLKATAERISSVLRQSDTVALLGGGKRPAMVSRLTDDEFGVALTDISDIESVTWIIQRIFDCLGEPLQIGEHEIYLTCSIGVSSYPHDGEAIETLLRCASMARIHANKRLGRNKFAFFAREMNDLAHQRIRLDTEMRHAIKREEFLLEYQPKFDLRSGKVTAMEALIRWQHPDAGIIEPNVFIPIAEHTGFIETLGEWVLYNACREARRWVDDGNKDARIAVNVSMVQLWSENFTERLIAIVDEAGLSPHFLELEITESVVMEDVETAAIKLRELRAAGIHISIDDFGTGYSSLAYLKRFAADVLKVDRAFIADVANDANDAALVAAIIAMAHRLGLRVVAEGVETEEQLTYLRAMQCDEAQGYLLGRPLSSENARLLLNSGFRLDNPTGIDLEHGRTTAELANREPREPAKVVELSRG